MTEITIKTPKDRARAVEEINSLPEDKRWLVKITDWTGQRTAAQNKLLWKWNTEVGEHYGDTKRDAHLMLKELFLCHIFIRDDPGYAAMAAAIKKVKGEDFESYLALKKKVLELTSTTDCNPAQMVEYLTSIKLWCFHQKIKITIPKDEEFEWMCHVPKKKQKNKTSS
jgi:hypothetical protein